MLARKGNVSCAMQVVADRNFTNMFAVDRTPRDAFEASIDARCWWSHEIQGVTDRVGGEFEHHCKDVRFTTPRKAGPNDHGRRRIRRCHGPN